MRRKDDGKIDELIRDLETQCLSVEEIMSIHRVSQRTAYRWMDAAREEGSDVVRARKPGGGWGWKIVPGSKKGKAA
jgi:transposase